MISKAYSDYICQDKLLQPHYTVHQPTLAAKVTGLPENLAIPYVKGNGNAARGQFRIFDLPCGAPLMTKVLR